MKPLVLGVCVLSLLAAPLWGDEVVPYVLTEPQGFSAATVDAQSVYDNKPRGSLDTQVMPEVRPQARGPGLPAPYIVPFAEASQASEVLIGPVRTPAPPRGEDRIFEQIRTEPGSPGPGTMQQISD